MANSPANSDEAKEPKTQLHWCETVLFVPNVPALDIETMLLAPMLTTLPTEPDRVLLKPMVTELLLPPPVEVAPMMTLLAPEPVVVLPPMATQLPPGALAPTPMATLLPPATAPVMAPWPMITWPVLPPVVVPAPWPMTTLLPPEVMPVPAPWPSTTLLDAVAALLPAPAPKRSLFVPLPNGAVGAEDWNVCGPTVNVFAAFTAAAFVTCAAV